MIDRAKLSEILEDEEKTNQKTPNQTCKREKYVLTCNGKGCGISGKQKY